MSEYFLRSPWDIDLFTGGLLEKPVTGGTLGPTFECIIGKQFQRLKVGDRFWFQSGTSNYTRGNKRLFL